MTFSLVFSYKCMFVSRGQIIHVVFFDGLACNNPMRLLLVLIISNLSNHIVYFLQEEY